MAERTEKQKEQDWRNWCLKTLAGTRALLDRVKTECPETSEGHEGVMFYMDEMERKIRERQPPPEAKKAKVRRIYVS